MTYETEQDLLPPNFILKMPAEGEEALATGNQTGAYSTEANFFQHFANQGIGGTRKSFGTFCHSDFFRSAEWLKEIEIDEAAKGVLGLYDEICASPDFHLDMWLEPGEMQFISNHTIFHARTEYQDWPERERRRHLLRLWLSL